MNSAFNEFPHERTEFSDQTYAAIGRALAYATAFEAICRSLSSIPEARQAMSLASESEPDADAAFGKAVEAVWGKRLREHVGRIFEQYQLAGDVASRSDNRESTSSRRCSKHDQEGKGSKE